MDWVTFYDSYYDGIKINIALIFQLFFIAYQKIYNIKTNQISTDKLTKFNK